MAITEQFLHPGIEPYADCYRVDGLNIFGKLDQNGARSSYLSEGGTLRMLSSLLQTKPSAEYAEGEILVNCVSRTELDVLIQALVKHGFQADDPQS